MPCTKRAFASPAAAKTQLRTWQQKGRRAALDTGHVYKADCVEHKGQFHVGRKHDSGPSSKLAAHNYTQMRDRILDEMDDLFDRQAQRIHGKLNRLAHKRRNRFVTQDEGDYVRPDYGTIRGLGDEIDVEVK